MARRDRFRRIAMFSAVGLSAILVLAWGLSWVVSIRMPAVKVRQTVFCAGLSQGTLEYCAGDVDPQSRWSFGSAVTPEDWCFSVPTVHKPIAGPTSAATGTFYSQSMLAAFHLPILAPLLIVSIASVILYVIERRQRPLPGHCPTCRYDLTGNTTGVCPECGGKVKAMAKSPGAPGRTAS